MPEHDKERIPGETVEEIDGRKYTNTLIALETYKRERHGISNEPVIEGEINPPLPVVGQLDNFEIPSASKIIDINSLNDPNYAGVGHRIQTERLKKKEVRKAA